MTFISVRVRSVCTQHLFSRSGYQLCLAKCFQAECSCQPLCEAGHMQDSITDREPPSTCLVLSRRGGLSTCLYLEWNFICRTWAWLAVLHLGPKGTKVCPQLATGEIYCVPNLQLDGRGCVTCLCIYVWESGSWWQWGHVEGDIVGMWLGMLSRDQVPLRDCSCRWPTLGQRSKE